MPQASLQKGDSLQQLNKYIYKKLKKEETLREEVSLITRVTTLFIQISSFEKSNHKTYKKKNGKVWPIQRKKN